MSEKNKILIVILIISIITFLLFLRQVEKEKSLSKNKKETIGKVLKVSNKSIYYQYIIDGKWIDGRDPDTAAFPKFIRECKPEIGKYYKVIYDSTDIKNAKIIIAKKNIEETVIQKYLNNE